MECEGSLTCSQSVRYRLSTPSHFNIILPPTLRFSGWSLRCSKNRGSTFLRNVDILSTKRHCVTMHKTTFVAVRPKLWYKYNKPWISQASNCLIAQYFKRTEQLDIGTTTLIRLCKSTTGRSTTKRQSLRTACHSELRTENDKHKTLERGGGGTFTLNSGGEVI
jgi:hypothetical protein